jgi:hypothetical protein
VRRDSGSYAVLVSNRLGSALSSPALLTVRVPQRLLLPERQPDGSWRVRFGEADGTPLVPGDGERFEAHSSTDLMDWTQMQEKMSLTNSLFQFDDHSATQQYRRYYRILER